MEKENLNISGYQKTTRKTELAKNGKEGKHKVLIVGHSHARKYATNLQHNLGKNYKVTGFIKPGAQMREIINTANEGISTLKRKDVVVIRGGANDISRNNITFTLKDLSNFMNSNNEVNIVLVNSPHRYNLIFSSCVNKEVIKI
jgi:signal recognition particle GTPase